MRQWPTPFTTPLESVFAHYQSVRKNFYRRGADFYLRQADQADRQSVRGHRDDWGVRSIGFLRKRHEVLHDGQRVLRVEVRIMDPEPRAPITHRGIYRALHLLTGMKGCYVGLGVALARGWSECVSKVRTRYRTLAALYRPAKCAIWVRACWRRTEPAQAA